MTPTSEIHLTRPRVEGDRELEILHATLRVLADVGYDRLTMDAVAKEAHASKATLYRRWNTKVTLIIDALHVTGTAHDMPDTGTLRGDLMQLFCGLHGLMDQTSVATFASVMTAICRDPDFAEAFRRDVLEPKRAISQQVWERAKARGEVPVDLDVDLIEPCLAGIVLQRVFLLGEQPSDALITRILDQIILPAATHRLPAPDAAPDAAPDPATDSALHSAPQTEGRP